MAYKKLFIWTLAIGLTLIMACGGTTKSTRRDVDSESAFPSTTTDSKDFRTVAQKMARSIITNQEITNRPTVPRIVVLQIENRTNDYMDTSMFTEKIVTELVKYSQGRVRFVSREIDQAVQSERALKREGAVGSSGSKVKSGADYFLHGKLQTIDKAAGAYRETYTLYSFRLTDAESGDLVWADDYEIKKLGSAGVYDR